MCLFILLPPRFVSYILVDSEGKECEEIYVVEDYNIRYFDYQCYRFVFDAELQAYCMVPDRSKDWTFVDAEMLGGGLKSEFCSNPLVRVFEGYNLIDVPINPIWKRVIISSLGPVEMYQYFCCALWFAHNYIAFASLILVSIWISMSIEIYYTHQARMRMKEMAAYEVYVDVLRDGKWSTLSSINLLVGDVISIHNLTDKTLPCDLIVFDGEVIVDESSLTGESTPVVKQAINSYSKSLLLLSNEKNSWLYSGTVISKVIYNNDNNDNKDKVRAIVGKTGFNTAKGNLVRSMLFPKIVSYSFQYEIKLFLIGIVIIALSFFGTSLWIWTSVNEETIYELPTWLRAFESIAILIPPSLPLIFHIGIIVSASNLSKKSISTSNSSCIPISGKIGTFCFDKTGTLTKPDLDVIGVIPVTKNFDMNGYENSNGEQFFGDHTNVSDLKLNDIFLHSLATCHDLARIDMDNVNSNSELDHKYFKYSGSHLDIKMMLATNWEYYNKVSNVLPFSESPGKEKIFVVHRFVFDHALQLSSVVVRYQQKELNGKERMFIFVKGSPEAINAISKTGVPLNYEKESERHSKDGCYVIAFAYRELTENEFQIDTPNRFDYECNLSFAGFLLLRNEPKEDTSLAIQQLRNALIKPKIITGDNIYTAFYVGKKCNIVNSNSCFIGEIKTSEYNEETLGVHLKRNLIINQMSRRNVWRSLDNPDIVLLHSSIQSPSSYYSIDRLSSGNQDICLGVSSNTFEYCVRNSSDGFIFSYITIFARMKPHQKEKVILIHKQYDFVGMCGDGANDCSALGAAHCGLALSQTEASISSPFCSSNLSILSVVDLIKESRACLANSFSGFKYTIFYGLLQTTQMMVSYAYFADLTQWMYLFEDFVLYFLFAIFVVKSKASSNFFGDSPTFSLFGTISLLSLFGQIFIWILILFLTVYFLSAQSWYEKEDNAWELESTRACIETTSIFYVGNFILIAAAISWSLGGIWRESVYKNIGVMVIYVITMALSLIFMFAIDSIPQIGEFIGLVILPLEWRLYLLLIAFSGVSLMVFLEKLILLNASIDWIKSHFSWFSAQSEYTSIVTD